MNVNGISNLIKKQFPYNLTSGQESLISMLSEFILDKDEKSLFQIKGYAGTGKTTIVSSLVKILPQLNIKSVLLAPTGRAAKVLSSYSGKKAFTIHKKIYRPHTAGDGTIVLKLQDNLHKNTIFIVDEASMIPDASASGNHSLFSMRDLLDDLIQYVYNKENCRLILIGDTAQLPPVGSDISPALDTNLLKNIYPFKIYSFELKEVVRQSLQSGILANATSLRKKINSGKYDIPLFSIEDCDDVFNINGLELQDEIYNSYSEYGEESTIIITRSNKRANIYNQEIRNRILFREEEISAGDLLMVVRNNYFWLDSNSKAGFIANGDIIELLRIYKYEELYGFRFADVSVRLVDYPDEKEIDLKIMLNTLTSETPSLSFNDNRKLFEEILKDHEDLPHKRSRIEKVKNSPFFNALQIKFAYALTCHKTQGGQWKSVFIDQGYLRDDMIDKEYLRWLYTATTRATKKLQLINFNENLII